MPNQQLNVLESMQPVINGARFVKINQEKLAEHCAVWAAKPFTTPPWDTAVHWQGQGKALANYILLLDCLNFCFWPDPGQPKWSIEYATGGKRSKLNGYNALAAALKRAAEAGQPILEAEWMAQATRDDVAEVFRGENEIPLMDKRCAHINETGRVLLEKYQGQFANAIESCQGSAVALVNLLADNFSSFHDIWEWHGHTVRILKRAQITVVDLYGSFDGREYGAFNDISRLTAFADYKIPQVLRALGILEYSPELAEKVDNYRLIEAGSDQEIEIRVSMVWAIDLICQELARLQAPRLPLELDWFFWNMGQLPLPNEKPYHRTRTICY